MDKLALLTVEDLIKFFEEKKFDRFSSKETGHRIRVQIPATFEIDDQVDDAHRNMMRLKIKIFHTGLNRNGSHVSEESAKAAMPSIKNRPVLAYIHQLDDGTWDFEGHNIEIVEHEDGTQEVVYLESQVGSFSEEEPFFEYDEKTDKTYVCSYAWISREYTKAAEIIERKNGSKNSVELSIDELSFNAKEKYLDLIAFYVEASTLLGSKKDGTEIGEGMLGSRADISDFSTTPERVSSYYNRDEKLIETLEKLNETLTKFNIDENNQKGGNELVGKFEELLTQYNITAEDITFEYENMSDEELEAKFAEVFGEDNTENPASDNPDTNSGEGENFENETPTSEGEGEGSVDNEPEVFENMQRIFEISHEDIRYALYNLLAPYEQEDNEYYWIIGVYDDHFAYENWNGGTIYGQKYAKDGDNVSFDGERYKLFRELLTESEKMELDSMRSNYSSIKADLEQYQKAEESAKKDALFISDDYKNIAEQEDFAELKNNHENLSFADLTAKLDAMLLAYAKTGALQFTSVEVENKPSITTKQFADPNTKKKNNRYGTLKF